MSLSSKKIMRQYPVYATKEKSTILLHNGIGTDASFAFLEFTYPVLVATNHIASTPN